MLWNPEEKEKELRTKIDQKTKAKERLKNMQKKYSLLKRLQMQLKKTVKKTHLF
jgi:hypothetical protein